MEWNTAPTSSTRATGVLLARQPQPPSPPPPQPSILQDPSSSRRADKPDYGRSGDGVKFPPEPEPFGDLELGTTNENEPLAKKLPSLATSTHINKLVAYLQTAVDKLE